MATNTTRLGIRKPAGTDIVNVVTDIDAGMDILDTSIDRICTSSTRPSSAYVGMRILETDTARELYCVSLGPIVWRYMGILLVADATARTALTPIYEGMQIYRIDKDWTELYDGSAWRVKGTVTVAATADITAPYTGQIVILTTDTNMYRWTGSAWVIYAPPALAVTNRGRVSLGSNQTLAAVADVSGCTLTFTTLTANCVYMVSGCFDQIQTNDSTNTSVFSCSVDGSAFADTLNVKPQSSGVGLAFRTTQAKLWTGTLATAGSHTIKLRCATTGSTTAILQSGNTTMDVITFAA